MLIISVKLSDGILRLVKIELNFDYKRTARVVYVSIDQQETRGGGRTSQRL